jgi:predicted nucleic acid-binding protein
VDYLVDTNILLRYANRTHEQHDATRAAVRALRSRGERLRPASQNFVEFWNVATRPLTKNGFGLTTVAALKQLRFVERLFPLLPDSAAVYPEWRRFVTTYSIEGVQVHDARLAATMIVYGITHILTFNTTDFRRYASEGIITIHPDQV